MNPETPVTNYLTPTLGPSKRKRGRPRKSCTLEDQLQSVGSARRSNDITIGQTVSGIIEASFDGGYLLSLKAGKSGAHMRGVVFKPGRYVPVSTENDVAPEVKMIKRSEARLRSEHLSNMHASGGQTREKNGGVYHPTSFSPSTLVSRGSKLLPPVSPPAMCPTLSRGKVVPVVLQPISSANDSIVTTQHQGIWTGAAAQNQSMGEGPEPRAPSENLGMDRQADGTPEESSKSGVRCSSTSEDEVSDGDDHPLFVEPLQTQQPLLAGLPNIIPQMLDNDRTAKMTRLLQAVQENATSNVFSQMAHQHPDRSEEMSHAVDRA